MEQKNVITEKTSLFYLAGPMFLEMFLNILLNNVDTLMLSHYSENAVGAVGNANQVMNLLILMIMIFQMTLLKNLFVTVRLMKSLHF